MRYTKYTQYNEGNSKSIKNKKYLFPILSATVILIALVPILKGLLFTGVPDDAIKMELSMSGFSPNVIEAKAGETIQVYMINMDNQYHSDGGGWHQFASDDLDFDFNIGPKKKQLVSVTVDQPGEYDFYCDVCCGGKENPYMQGKIIVT